MGHSGATQLLDVVGIVATTRTGLHLSWMLSCTYETWLSTDGWGFGSWSGNREGRVRLIGSDSSNCTGLSYRRVVCRSTQVCTHKNAVPIRVWYESKVQNGPTPFLTVCISNKLHCCTVHFWGFDTLAPYPYPNSSIQNPSNPHGARTKRTQPRRGWSWASSAPVIPSCGCTRQAETSSGARPSISNSG